MKKHIVISIVGLFTFVSSYACDVCGCSSGNYFIGPFPVFQRHFVGVRYTFRSFDTRLRSDASQFSKDFYQTTELWGGLNIDKKWQLLAFIPYNINRQSSDDGNKTNKGLGDISMIINYNVFSASKINKKWQVIRHELWIGGGVKIPTGSFNADASALVPSANNQPGTGSVDYIMTATYSLRVRQFGLSSNVTYKANESAKDFHFGNRLAANVFGSYSIGTEKVTFTPNAGILYEKLNPNTVNKINVQDTGGQAVSAATGLEMSFSKLSVGVNLQLPVSEHISAGQTHTRLNGMVHMTFSL